MYNLSAAQVIDLLEAGNLDPRPGQPILSTMDECPALYEVQDMAPVCTAATNSTDYAESGNRD